MPRIEYDDEDDFDELPAEGRTFGQRLATWLLAAAAILTLWSGFEYARAAWPALRAQEHAVAVQQGVDTPK